MALKVKACYYIVRYLRLNQTERRHDMSKLIKSGD